MSASELAARARQQHQPSTRLRVLFAGSDGYGDAVEALAARGLHVTAAASLDHGALAAADVLVLSQQAAAALDADDVERFVQGGGGVVVLEDGRRIVPGEAAERLLARLGLAAGDAGPDALAGRVDLLAGLKRLADRPGIRIAQHGGGHVALLAGARTFTADGSLDEHHETLWLNLVYWTAGATFKRPAPPAHVPAAEQPQWAALKRTVEALRAIQAADGSVDVTRHSARAVHAHVAEAIAAIEGLAPFFPHQQDYVAAAVRDLEGWIEDGLQAPEFGASLACFRPADERVDGRQYLAVFPMYKQNGPREATFEAVIFGVAWPDWLAEIERTGFENPSFVPGILLDWTGGYDSECAVLFPEMVNTRSRASGAFGVIFCDREAKRFRAAVACAADRVSLRLPPDAAAVLESEVLSREAFQLWDLLHDHTHHHGFMPFEWFMSRRRMPYWMYSLEELRCDLVAYAEAVRLEREGLLLARNAQYVILLDRLLRFPIVGERRRNYDGLAGQIIFGFLYREGCLEWCDDRLTIAWEALPDAMAELRARVEALYRDGVARDSMHHWRAGHELVAEYVSPAIASRWAGAPERGEPGGPESWLDAVLPDEFPLSMFYLALRRRVESG